LGFRARADLQKVAVRLGGRGPIWERERHVARASLSAQPAG
jgi:hypothetical protein